QRQLQCVQRGGARRIERVGDAAEAERLRQQYRGPTNDFEINRREPGTVIRELRSETAFLGEGTSEDGSCDLGGFLRRQGQRAENDADTPPIEVLCPRRAPRGRAGQQREVIERVEIGEAMRRQIEA